MIVKESHGRTAVKTVVYRVLCTIAVYFIALSLGADSAASGTMALASAVLGTILYYAHDRLWTRSNWRRTEQGTESVFRSSIKTISYRIVVIIVATVLARLIFADSAGVAVTFALAQTVVNMFLYYMVERVANRIQAGRQVIIGA